MIRSIFPLIICIATLFLACTKNEEPQTVTSAEKYKDKVFSAIAKTTVQFDAQPNYDGSATMLYADLYKPVGDTSESRAAIIYVHGGGATRDQNNIPYLCTELAKRGYVVASIDYRSGVEDTSATAKSKARLRAVQDVKSFIRYTKQNSASAKIDVSRIFITGSSAGGVAVLATAFLDYGEQPAYLNPLTAADLQGYGNLNGNNASIKGVYSMWGAVDDTAWIKTGDIPVGCIHSIDDPTVPWDYSPTAGNGDGYPGYGSHAINIRAKNVGIYTTLYGYESDKHSLGMNFPQIDTTITEMANFFYPLAR